MIWVMVIMLIAGASGIGWGVYRFQSKSESSQKKEIALTTCDQLREFIVKEEETSYQNWKKYHRSVMKYEKGIPKKERPALVRTISSQVLVVLESDLRIYKKMRKQPECLTNDFRSEMQEWIKSTKDTIDYLTKGKEVDGNIFDPDEGFWDSSFYNAFYSATDNLSTALTNV